MKYIHKGWLSLEEDSNGHETVTLDGEPVAEAIDYISGKVVTVRYYISDKEGTEEELHEDFMINTLYGNLKSEYSARYSAMTGYLWTDDELNIGGHNLREELESYVGKYLYLIVEVDEEAEKRKRENQIQENYRWYILNVVDKSKAAGKSLEEVLKDIEFKWNSK